MRQRASVVSSAGITKCHIPDKLTFLPDIHSLDGAGRTCSGATTNLSSWSSIPIRYMKIPAMNFRVSLVRSDIGASGYSLLTARRTVALTRESPKNSMLPKACPEAMLPNEDPGETLDARNSARRYRSHFLIGTCTYFKACPMLGRQKLPSRHERKRAKRLNIKSVSGVPSVAQPRCDCFDSA